MQRNMRGFTIAEMTIAVAISGILLAMAIPSYRAMIQNNRAIAFSSEFIRSLNFTRGEVVKRSVRVSICAASTTSSTTCGASSQWTNGWLVFEDNSGNGVFNSGVDTLLRRHDSLEGQGIIAAPASAITFTSAGFISAGAGTFQLTATDCVGNYGQQVNVSNSGRIGIQSTMCS